MGPWLRRLARMALSEAAIATTWRCTSIPAPLAPIQWLPLAATAPAPATATLAHLWALVSATAAVVVGAKALVAARALALADLRAVVAARAYHALVAVREIHALVAAGALALSRR